MIKNLIPKVKWKYFKETIETQANYTLLLIIAGKENNLHSLFIIAL